MTMNTVNSNFKRNWNRDDMMNLDEISLDIHRSLKKVYLTLFCAMLSCTFGSFMYFISVVGENFTVLSYVASLILIYFTPTGRVKTRVSLSILVAYSFGASVGIFTNYLFKIEKSYVLRFLGGTIMGIGYFLYGAITSSERSEIYHGCQRHCIGLMITGFAFILLDIYTALWAITSLFMEYLVLYSQEIMYDANFGDINFVNCTFIVFFYLPAIVIRAVRVYLQDAEIEQHGP